MGRKLELSESMTINMAYHVNDPAVGMSLYSDRNSYTDTEMAKEIG